MPKNSSPQQQKPRILGEKTFLCSFPDCGKLFSTMGNLKTHHLIHSNTRPHKCTYPGCDSDFRQAINLKAHMRTHTGERPFLCLNPDCGKLFTALSSVRRHVRHHHYPGRRIPPGSYMDMTRSTPCANGERRSKESFSSDDDDDEEEEEEEEEDNEEGGTESDVSTLDESDAPEVRERKRKREDAEGPSSVKAAVNRPALLRGLPFDKATPTVSATSLSPPATTTLFSSSHSSTLTYLEHLAKVTSEKKNPCTQLPLLQQQQQQTLPQMQQVPFYPGPMLFTPPPVFWPIVNSPGYIQQMMAWSNAMSLARSTWNPPQSSTVPTAAQMSPTPSPTVERLPTTKKLAISTLLN